MKPATAQPASEPSRPATAALVAGAASRPTWLDDLPGMAFLGGTDPDRTLEWVSNGSGALLGLASAAPFALAPLIHPEEREMVLDYVASATADLQSFVVEYRVRQANGHWRTVWEQSRPVRHGHQIFLHGYLVDVTARVERDRARGAAEQERLQNQNTLALNKLFVGIAHEFNNLLHGILTSAENIAAELPPDHPAHESLKNIFASYNRSRDFDQKIRALAQRPPLERKLIPLAPVIEDCLQILHTIIPDKVEITTNLAPGCPAVSADSASLHQVVMNLCLQAWQRLPDRRGRLDLALTHHSRGFPSAGSSVRSGSHLCLTVRDNGPGLDKYSLGKIFDPFCSRKQAGLEMYRARETVQAHQGEIIVESEPDQGTACHIYLPVAG